MIKKIKFYSTGSFVAETTTKEIEGKDIKDIIINSVKESKNIIERHGSTPYCFVIEGQHDFYYLSHHKIELYDDIKKRNDPKDRILLSNMECNHWKAVLTSTSGWKSTQPFDDHDCLLDDNGNILLKGYEADINILRTRKLERILK